MLVLVCIKHVYSVEKSTHFLYHNDTNAIDLKILCKKFFIQLKNIFREMA